MDHQQGFVVGVSSRGRPIKRTCDHFSFIDHRELVMQLVAEVEVRGTDPCICSAFEGSAQGCSGFSWVPKPEPKPGGHLISCWDALWLLSAFGSADLAFLSSGDAVWLADQDKGIV